MNKKQGIKTAIIVIIICVIILFVFWISKPLAWILGVSFRHREIPVLLDTYYAEDRAIVAIKYCFDQGSYGYSRTYDAVIGNGNTNDYETHRYDLPEAYEIIGYSNHILYLNYYGETMSDAPVPPDNRFKISVHLVKNKRSSN